MPLSSLYVSAKHTVRSLGYACARLPHLPAYRLTLTQSQLPGKVKRIYFYHVRKTGGTSLAHAFLALAHENPGVVERRMRRPPFSTASGPYRFAYQDPPLLRWGYFFFGYGHQPAETLRLPDRTFTVTILRDPVDRVVSLYRYLADPRADEGQTFHSLAYERQWAADGFEQFLNRVSRIQLLNQLYMFSRSGSVSEAAGRILACDQILYTDDLDRGMGELASTLDLPLAPRRVRESRFGFQPSGRETARLREMLDPEYQLLAMVPRPHQSTHSGQALPVMTRPSADRPEASAAEPATATAQLSSPGQPAGTDPPPGHGPAGTPAHAADGGAVSISVVMPCLNEAGSVAQCVAKALRAIARTGLPGEVVVCDNGSADGSAELAAAAGARVVHEPRRGYGSAYLRGFAAAKGTYLFMGDADDSYDFGEIPNLLARLRDGYDYVVGSRFEGEILPGAMPWTHRYLGNPVLTGVLNRLFGIKLSDAHSGLRAITRDAYDRLMLSCTGMEFASEMAVRAAQTGLATIEVPITYHPRSGSSKLRPLQDGWRHLRFLTRMIPGLMMILAGLFTLVGAAAAVVVVQPALAGEPAGLSLPLTILFSLGVLLSGQVIALGAAAHVHSLNHASQSRSQLSHWIERGLRAPLLHLLGPALFAVGLAAEIATLVSADGPGPLSASVAQLCLSVISLATMMFGVQTSIAVSHLARVPAGAHRAAAVSSAFALAALPADPHDSGARPRPGSEDGSQYTEKLPL